MKTTLAIVTALALLLLYRVTGRRQRPAVRPVVDDWRVRMEGDYILVEGRIGQ